MGILGKKTSAFCFFFLSCKKVSTNIFGSCSEDCLENAKLQGGITMMGVIILVFNAFSQSRKMEKNA